MPKRLTALGFAFRRFAVPGRVGARVFGLNIGCRYSTPVRKRPLHSTRSQFKPEASQTQAPVTPATEPERRAGGSLTTLRLHHELRPASGCGDPQSLRLQGRARLPLAGADRGGLPHLFRPHAACGACDPRRPHARRLRGGAAEGRAPGQAGGTGGARRHAERRMRRQAGPAPAGRLQGVGAAMPGSAGSARHHRPLGWGLRSLRGSLRAVRCVTND